MSFRGEWPPSTGDLLLAEIGFGRRRRNLVVEPLPGGRWDRVTWSSDHQPAGLQGNSADPWTAMQDSERAARLALAERYGWCARHAGRHDEMELAFERKVHYLCFVQSSGWASAFL